MLYLGHDLGVLLLVHDGLNAGLLSDVLEPEPRSENLVVVAAWGGGVGFQGVATGAREVKSADEKLSKFRAKRKCTCS